jgi:sugar phosphate isomerase/epimerase
MPQGLLEAASQGKKYDDEQNMLMCDYITDIIVAVRHSSIRSLECYYMLAWDAYRVWQTMQKALEGHKGLQFWSVHAPYGYLYDPSSPDPQVRLAAVEACAEAVKVAKMVGAGVVIVHPGANVDAPVSRKERLGLSAETLSEIAENAATEGVKVAVEPLPKQEVGNTIAELLAIIRAADHPNLGVCLDTNHIFPASGLPSAIRSIGDKLVSVHVSDHDGTGEKHWLPYMGIVDWRAISKALHDVDYKGPLIYETHGFPPPKGGFQEIVQMVEENYERLAEDVGLTQLNLELQGTK